MVSTAVKDGTYPIATIVITAVHKHFTGRMGGCRPDDAGPRNGPMPACENAGDAQVYVSAATARPPAGYYPGMAPVFRLLS